MSLCLEGVLISQQDPVSMQPGASPERRPGRALAGVQTTGQAPLLTLCPHLFRHTRYLWLLCATDPPAPVPCWATPQVSGNPADVLPVGLGAGACQGVPEEGLVARTTAGRQDLLPGPRFTVFARQPLRSHLDGPHARCSLIPSDSSGLRRTGSMPCIIGPLWVFVPEASMTPRVSSSRAFR